MMSKAEQKKEKTSTLYDNSWNRDPTEMTQKCKDSWTDGQRFDQRATVHVLPGHPMTWASPVPMALPYALMSQRNRHAGNLQLLPCFVDCILFSPVSQGPPEKQDKAKAWPW